MLAACSLPGETGRERISGSSAAFGVSRRWPWQQTACVSGVQIAADADLDNLRQLALEVSNEVGPSVAETLARQYLLHGPDFVRYLQGSFSIAIWDEKSQHLVLAVDRFGFKTLYWSLDGRQRLLFASRVGAVRAAQTEPAPVNPSAIAQYLLFSAIPAPLTIYKGIERLSPGFILILNKDSQITTKRYWDLEYVEDTTRRDVDWARDLREEIKGAVHRNLDGCGIETTGAYLSGGTDSSSVVAFMSDRFKPVHSFSISFPIDSYNEIGFARTTAKRFATRHHERCLRPEDAAATIPKLIRYYDEPFANSSAIASYHCALLARESGVDTLLAGDGGDELFGGNARYATDKRFALYHSIPKWIRRILIEPCASLLPDNDGRVSLPRRYIRRAQIPNPRRILSYNLFLNRDVRDIFDPDFLQEVPEPASLAIAEEHFRSAQASSELNRLLYMDVKMTLGDNDLRKVSGTAELAGIRVRYPLLDARLVEFSGHIPTYLKLRGMEKRYIFKRAMKDILPDQVLHKKKHGFGVPLGQWLLRDAGLKSFAQELLRDRKTRQRGYFRQDFLDQLTLLHQHGDAGFYGEFVWYLIALELWHREHLESFREASFAR
jgi:asparagine synthase (glutamine-hydrolysing)